MRPVWGKTMAPDGAAPDVLVRGRRSRRFLAGSGGPGRAGAGGLGRAGWGGRGLVEPAPDLGARIVTRPQPHPATSKGCASRLLPGERGGRAQVWFRQPHSAPICAPMLASGAGLGYTARVGSLAQLVERLVYTENVGGSSPSRPTMSRAVAAFPTDRGVSVPDGRIAGGRIAARHVLRPGMSCGPACPAAGMSWGGRDIAQGGAIGD